MLVTNISDGPRGINGTKGAVLLRPGDAQEIEISAVEAKVAEGTGWFKLDGKPSAEPKAKE